MINTSTLIGRFFCWHPTCTHVYTVVRLADAASSMTCTSVRRTPMLNKTNSLQVVQEDPQEDPLEDRGRCIDLIKTMSSIAGACIKQHCFRLQSAGKRMPVWPVYIMAFRWEALQIAHLSRPHCLAAIVMHQVIANNGRINVHIFNGRQWCDRKA